MTKGDLSRRGFTEPARLERAIYNLSTVGCCGAKGLRDPNVARPAPSLAGVVVMDIAARFGDNLKRVRREAGVSQDELAVRASVHRTEISQLERGLRVARIDTLIKLAASLKRHRPSC